MYTLCTQSVPRGNLVSNGAFVVSRGLVWDYGELVITNDTGTPWVKFSSPSLETGRLVGMLGTNKTRAKFNEYDVNR